MGWHKHGTTFSAFVLVVAVKYVLLMMRADNQGEGGIFALLALALRGPPGKHLPWILTMFGLAGASLFYGDSMITPAISVLSAVEGLEVAISRSADPSSPVGWCPAETAGVAQPLS